LTHQYFATCRYVGVNRKNNNNSNILLFANFFWFQYYFCYRYHLPFIVFPKIRKTILTQQYFARCRIVSVIRKHNNHSHILLFANFFWFQYYFCYRYHLPFIVFPKIRKTILTQQYFARCRTVGVTRKNNNNNNSNILLFAIFPGCYYPFFVVVLATMHPPSGIHCIAHFHINCIATWRYVGVIGKNHNNNSNILLGANLFLIAVFFLLLLSYAVHRICQHAQKLYWHINTSQHVA
jgi:hypothetical protein